MKKILLIAEHCLQTSLIEEQLLSQNNAYVDVCLPTEAIAKSHSTTIDLVVLDFQYMTHLLSLDQLPDFDLFGWPLLIHNVPTDSVNTEVLRWRVLRGVLLRDAHVAHLGKSTEYILRGGLWMPRRYLERLVIQLRYTEGFVESPHQNLTGRERQILELLTYGNSNQQIASQLFLSESTVKSHIYKLYKKLDVHSRREAIKAVRPGGSASLS